MSTNSNSNEKNEFDDAFGQFKNEQGYNALKEELMKIGAEHPEWKKLIDLPMCKSFPSIDWSSGIFLKSFMTMSLEIQDDLLKQYYKSLESGGGDFVFNLIKQFATYKFIANYLETRKEFFKNTSEDLCILNKTFLSDIMVTFTVPAVIEKYVVKDSIKLDIGKGINISGFGNNFKEWFFGKIEYPFSGSTVHGRNTNRHIDDGHILTELGGDQAITTLTEMYYAIANQPNGESGGPLLNCDGRANIFYVKDVNNILRVVHTDWRDNGWFVHANSVEQTCGWLAGDRVFSRNSAITHN